jgi:hypothetical protein
MPRINPGSESRIGRQNERSPRMRLAIALPLVRAGISGFSKSADMCSSSLMERIVMLPVF